MSESYLRRINQLVNRFGLHQTHEVSIEALESTLMTSRRNISKIMTTMAALGWITWQPAVGRGKKSQLQIHYALQDAMLSVIRSELDQGRFTLIPKLLASYGHPAARALALATEQQSQWNETHNHLLITQYPWVDAIDPVKTFRRAELQIVKSVYDTLLTRDRSGHLRAGLAHSWEVSGCVVRLWLRPDVQRHDGQVLSCDDVRFSLQRLAAYPGPVALLFSQIAAIQCLGDGQIEVTLTKPNPFFIYTLTTPNAAIVTPAKITFPTGQSCFVGTGPFRLVRWQEDSLVLTRHQDYFAKRALIRQITLSQGNDLTVTRQLSFNAGEGEREAHVIDAFSYLSIRHRPDARVSEATLSQLIDYIQDQKWAFDPNHAVDGLGQPMVAPEIPLSCPVLTGTVVLATPELTIPYLQEILRWLQAVIEATGLVLEVMTLTEISRPESVQGEADLLFLEEVLEQPFEYGVYEWMLTASGLRFIYSPEQLARHQGRVEQAIACDAPLDALLALDRSLIQSRYYVPLFAGREYIYSTRQVSGIHVPSTGYSDFHKLWIKSDPS